ncbi:MAG: hypothetical protein QOK17_101 [Sphingomonadales bacterium]|jgi:hypothetical protein|nr:hypothetical protein [Sphingomonadales bacterium]
MEAVLTFAAIIAAAMTFLWLVGQFDQWVQKTRGVGAIGGRRADGMVAKIGVAILLVLLFVLYLLAGGGSHPVDGCFGSMRC